jgi:N-acetylglutamate synthase-like GNAT family acetyltransferase
MTDRVLVRLEGPAPAEAKDRLAEAGLPTADLDGGAATFFRLDDEAGPLGWGAYELHGRDALLRSVVVAAGRRRAGAGTELVTRILRAASADGARRAWLLTETAPDFFARLGFVPARRDRAPAAIRGSAEFSRLCPDSARCMALDLDGA